MTEEIERITVRRMRLRSTGELIKGDPRWIVTVPPINPGRHAWTAGIFKSWDRAMICADQKAAGLARRAEAKARAAEMIELAREDQAWT